MLKDGSWVHRIVWRVSGETTLGHIAPLTAPAVAGACVDPANYERMYFCQRGVWR